MHERYEPMTQEGQTTFPACEHEWVVFSTALAEVCLMLQCVKCHAMGSIDDPSKEEWAEAFNAPARPYRWNDPTRVRIRHQSGPRFVMRREPGKSCGCPRECSTPGEYDRVPGEIMTAQRLLTPEQKSEVEELANVVAESNLCSHVFPLFVRSFERDTGAEHSAAVHDIVDRIEQIDDKGLHFGPTVVAQVLREYAAGVVNADHGPEATQSLPGEETFRGVSRYVKRRNE